jgi:hypothetical protein
VPVGIFMVPHLLHFLDVLPFVKKKTTGNISRLVSACFWLYRFPFLTFFYFVSFSLFALHIGSSFTSSYHFYIPASVIKIEKIKFVSLLFNHPFSRYTHHFSIDHGSHLGYNSSRSITKGHGFDFISQPSIVWQVYSLCM